MLYIYISIHTHTRMYQLKKCKTSIPFSNMQGVRRTDGMGQRRLPYSVVKTYLLFHSGTWPTWDLADLFTWIFRSYCPLMSYGIFHDCRILNMLMQHKGCGFGYSLYLWTTSVDDLSITEESFNPSVVALSLGMPSLHQDCRFIWSSRHGRMILSILLKSDQVIPYHDHHIPQTSRCYSMKLQAIYRTRTSFLFKWVCGRAFPSQQIGRW